MISLLWTLASPASALPLPVAEVPYHRLTWDDAAHRYRHLHETDCVDANGHQKMRPYDFSWNHSTTAAGVQGVGNDTNMLRYTICEGSWSEALERAFQAFRDAGVLMSEWTTPCPTYDLDVLGRVKEVPWQGSFDPTSGDFVFEARHTRR